jgi:signal transduction histidine kinase
MTDELRPLMGVETVQFSSPLPRLESLISAIAHQLRNPLNNMSMRLELLRNEVGEGAIKHIDKLRHEMNRLDETVETLLKFIFPANLKLLEFDIGEMLKELGARVGDDRIRVEFSIEPDLPLILADREMIYDALMNVIANALEAMPEGGTLTLSAIREASATTVSISDSGPGIEAENLTRVFELYYTTKPSGKGLGLSNALRSIELNGGTITMKSLAGQGAVCSISLPISSDTSANSR